MQAKSNRGNYPPTKYPLICQQCEERFSAWKREQRYCSRACRGKAEALAPEERFWNLVQKGAGCWKWRGAVTSRGYGTFTVSTTPRLTVQPHRFSWELTQGPIPDALCVLHRCDTPLCVNPEHLFLGTKKDNSDDMGAKGRRVSTKGEDNRWAKLTDGDVREIRRLLAQGELSQQRIGAMFGVCQAGISRIKLGKGWKHV